MGRKVVEDAIGLLSGDQIGCGRPLPLGGLGFRCLSLVEVPVFSF
ncbi:hypothetical protein [Anaplasma platys]|nr:hypothetical protein [Anaplasma platys]